MKKIINFLKYGNYNKRTYKRLKNVINANNYKRLILFCFIGFFINLLLLLLSIILNNHLISDGSHLYLIMIFISTIYLIILNFIFKNKDKKFVTILFYIYILISLYCYKTLDVNYNLNSTASLLCMIYIVSGYLFVDIPIRYICVTLIFTIWLCIDTWSLKPYNLAVMDITNCFIAYIIGTCMCYYHFNERLSKVIEMEKTEKERDTDYLTGLYTRIATENDITECLQNKAKKSVMIMVDLDDFKSINDNYGHNMGDKILQQVANVMKGCFRKDDIVSRIGGDEFIIFIPDIPNRKFAQEKVELLRNEINKIKIDEDKYLTCSIGISFPKETKDYDELFKEVDSAMYEAKKSSKNSFKIYKRKR